MKGIRKLPNASKKVLYLTFDDGPVGSATPAVLEVLEKYGVHATFFVVGQKAERMPELLQDIRTRGHTIGNHSLDHGYSRFFRSHRALLQWIEIAEHSLETLLSEKPVGFRPPAGVITPLLYSALKELKIPLILWQIRFFDLAFTWNEKRALKSLQKTKSGDIVLLHDGQPSEKLSIFLKTLDLYLVSALRLGFEFEVLTRELTQAAAYG